MRVRVQVGLSRRGKEIRIRPAATGHGSDKILFSSVETGRDGKITLSCLSDFLSRLGWVYFGGRASWVRIHGWGSPGEISVSVEGSVGDERHSRLGKSPRKDDSSESALLFQEEDILKVKKEKRPWGLRLTLSSLGLALSCLVLFSLFPFLARLFLVGKPEWSGEYSRCSRQLARG